jgi:hypothetical protein
LTRELRANSGNSWAIGSAFHSAWAGSTENLVGNVPLRSHGAMIEVMLQVGGQLVTISLPTQTFVTYGFLGIPRAWEKWVLASQDRGKFSVRILINSGVQQ